MSKRMDGVRGTVVCLLQNSSSPNDEMPRPTNTLR